MVSYRTIQTILMLMCLFFLAGCSQSAPVISTGTGAPEPAAQIVLTATPEATVTLLSTPRPAMTSTSVARQYQTIAYFPEWEFNRPYYVKNIIDSGSASRITLINYAFGYPDPDPKTGEIVCQMRDAVAAYQQAYTAEMSVDGQADRPDQPLRGHFNQLKKLKALYPSLKVVVSLGGWTDSTWFSDAALSAEAREKFVASCIDLYIHGNLPVQDGAGGAGAAAGVFDGIDIDWEYPVLGGDTGIHNRSEDFATYPLLLKEFRRQYQAIGRPDLLLTMAGPGPAQAAQYNMPEAHPYLDIVNLMTYDFAGAWSPLASHHTNLCDSQYDPQPAGKRISADVTIRLYRDSFGVPAEKIVLGAAFYGKAWKDVVAVNNGLYQPGQGMAEGGGNYYNLVNLLNKGYTRFWDDSARAPYLYSAAERIFWSYDDTDSLALKAQYVKHFGLGGIMFWEITGDDARGSLVEAIHQGLQPGAPDSDPCK
jgi:chitinase